MGFVKILWIGTIIFGFSLITSYVESCNEVVCASVVSKCMLTQSCKCDLKNCSCCKQCVDCLGPLYTECCSCVDLCPKPNDTRNDLAKKSHVEDFDGIPGLFDVMTASPDSEERWHTVKFPIDFDTILAGPKLEKDFKYYLKTNDQELDETLKERDHIVTVNCTVAYLTQCLSYNKCRSNCETMGASSFRWFHDGCCECVGSTCINYGINDSRCMRCPESKDDLNEDDPVDEDWQDYGEERGPFDGTVNSNF